jgi:hypothetical protein
VEAMKFSQPHHGHVVAMEMYCTAIFGLYNLDLQRGEVGYLDESSMVSLVKTYRYIDWSRALWKG